MGLKPRKERVGISTRWLKRNGKYGMEILNGRLKPPLSLRSFALTSYSFLYSLSSLPGRYLFHPSGMGDRVRCFFLPSDNPSGIKRCLCLDSLAVCLRIHPVEIKGAIRNRKGAFPYIDLYSSRRDGSSVEKSSRRYIASWKDATGYSLVDWVCFYAILNQVQDDDGMVVCGRMRVFVLLSGRRLRFA